MNKEVVAYKTEKLKARGYSCVDFKHFDFSVLKDLWAIRSRKDEYFTDAVMMFDTETSKDIEAIEASDNHVVCWTFSLRLPGLFNVFSLIGRKPTDFVKFIEGFLQVRKGEKIIFYAHNLYYDWCFMRGFLMKAFGQPVKMLATKPYYPIYIEFENGLILKDSAILAQRKLEKWGKDLNVQHKKLMGAWDYNARLNQDSPLTKRNIKYAIFDTLCGVECLDSIMQTLKKHIYNMPYTATGIPRAELRKRCNRRTAHEAYLKEVLSAQQQRVMEMVYHGGYVHGNRHFINTTLYDVAGGDFTSSYLFAALTGKAPRERFAPYKNCTIEEILNMKDMYAFTFKLILIKPTLKPDETMPVLQYSKCVNIINPVCDNGRILCADYVEIYTSELTLDLINTMYTFDHSACIEVECAIKGYLPRWYTDYIFECFAEKCKLKHNPAKHLYSIAKSKANCLYGLTVQHPVKDEIVEVYSGEENGLYKRQEVNFEEEYEKHVQKMSSILPYQWGCWITEISMYNLFKMGRECIDYKNGGIWFYGDTDSAYSNKWDMEAVKRYNDWCLEELRKNNYDAVVVDGEAFILGTITFDKDTEYSEFRYHGAKRYCGRNKYDNELHITIAGVPKNGYKCLKNDINNLVTGFIFDGKTTGKLEHKYFYRNELYIDKWGNEIYDSVDLSPCNYKLSTNIIEDFDELFKEEINTVAYDE